MTNISRRNFIGLSASALAAILSVLMSVGGLPEAKEGD